MSGFGVMFTTNSSSGSSTGTNNGGSGSGGGDNNGSNSNTAYAQSIANSLKTIATSYSGSSSSKFASTGNVVLSSGLIINWGTGSTTSGSGSITYSKAFTTQVFAIILTPMGSGAASDYALMASNSPSLSSSNVYGNSGQSLSFYYVAIGY
jgi:hypothetical protein